ncbi:MAG: cytochrome C [Deltaproteobacteria bacterium]|nr:cytochrome C [Deltaproteobacteria bacterium]
MQPLLEILHKPDNLPIVLMVFGFGFVLVWWVRTARRHDRLLAEEGESAVKREMDGPPPSGGKAEDLPGAKVHTWPYLLRIELLAAMAVMAFLGIWSILVDAPLEQLADPSRTPNPSKAPWYFLGLQEMLVYFDPWIAGVMLPLLIIVGLAAIPYLDVNPSGSGYYCFQKRRLAISVFLFGFLGLWLPLITVGTFFRGPGWGWFWPWEPWDPAAVVDRPTRNLATLVGIDSPEGSLVFGLLMMVGYFGGGFALAYSKKSRVSELYGKLGPARVGILVLLGLSMVGLPIKIVLRLLLDVKYIVASPWLNI